MNQFLGSETESPRPNNRLFESGEPGCVSTRIPRSKNPGADASRLTFALVVDEILHIAVRNANAPTNDQSLNFPDVQGSPCGFRSCRAIIVALNNA